MCLTLSSPPPANGLVHSLRYMCTTPGKGEEEPGRNLSSLNVPMVWRHFIPGVSAQHNQVLQNTSAAPSSHNENSETHEKVLCANSAYSQILANFFLSSYFCCGAAASAFTSVCSSSTSHCLVDLIFVLM